MNFKNALKTAALATALAFSGASQAAADITYNPVALGVIWNGGHMLSPGAFMGEQALSVYELGNTTLGDAFLAFCIQPGVEQLNDTIYTQNTGSLGSLLGNTVAMPDRTSRIHSLFEQNYASLSTGTADEKVMKRLSFQLALWDLVADDGDLYAATGQQYITSGSSAEAMVGTDPDTYFVNFDMSAAGAMLENSKTAVATNSYQYHWFSGVAGNNESQMLLGVSAVPEADTWAMMVVGLGLVGFMGRRKSSKSEKFAA